jgi:hypothetical protein
VSTFLEQGHFSGTRSEASLSGKVNNAINLFSDDRSQPACNILGAFINQIEAMMQGGSIDPETGASLIAEVSAIEECSAG